MWRNEKYTKLHSETSRIYSLKNVAQREAKKVNYQQLLSSNSDSEILILLLSEQFIYFDHKLVGLGKLSPTRLKRELTSISFIK